MSLIGLNRDLPFINIKALDVIFSDNVNVSSSMLQLLGVKIPKYSFSGFSYNSSTFDATWKLPSAISVDRLMLNLNGETAAPSTGSGPNIGATVQGTASPSFRVTSSETVWCRSVTWFSFGTTSEAYLLDLGRRRWQRRCRYHRLHECSQAAWLPSALISVRRPSAERVGPLSRRLSTIRSGT